MPSASAPSSGAPDSPAATGARPAPAARPFSFQTYFLTAGILAMLAGALFLIRKHMAPHPPVWRMTLAGLAGGALICGGPLLTLSVYHASNFASGISLPGLPLSLNQILGLMVLASWFLWMIAGRLSWPGGRYVWLLVAASIYFIFNAALGEDPEAGRLMARSIFIFQILGFVLLTSLRRPEHWTFWLWSLLIVTAIMTAFGPLEFITGLDFFPKQQWAIRPLAKTRINGLSKDAIIYSYFALWALGPGLYLAMESARRWQRTLAAALCVFLLFSAMITFNRQTPLIFFFMLLVALRLFRHRMVKPLAIFFLGLMALSAPYIAVKMGKRLTRAGELAGDYSYSIRRDKALIMWEIIKRKPLTGVGLESFTTVWPKYQPDNLYIVQLSKPRAHHPDLGYLQMLAESGIIGLTLDLVILFGGAALLLRRRRRALEEGSRKTANLCSALLVILTQVAIAQIIQDVFFHPRSWWLFGMIAVLSQAPDERIVRDPSDPALEAETSKAASPPDSVSGALRKKQASA